MESYLFMLLFVANAMAIDDCTTANDCDMIGSVCIKGSCVCSSGFVANSLYTHCLEIAEGYGSSCTDSIQCSASLKSGGLCSNNTCICSEGYHYYLGKCWKSAGLGESCKHNENCFVSYDFEASICNDKKVCECSPDYYQREYSSCRRKSYKPGDPCGIALDCQYKDAVCTTARTCGTSQNVSDYITKIARVQYMGTRFLSISKVGDNCTSSKECPKNGECNQRNKCTCKKGFFLKNNNCNAELGASCSGDEDCVGKNTMCRNGTYCVCKQGFVASASNQYCDKMSRYLGWSCLRNRECAFFGPGSICLSKKCHCNNSTHYVQNQMYCWVTKYVGDTCSKDEDCGGVDTMTCTNGTCKCVANSHASSDKIVCRKDSKFIGDACQETLDCTFYNSICNLTSHFCQCIKGYLYNNGSCVSGVGGKCKNTTDCYTEDTTCVKGVCTCQKNYVGSEDFKTCLPVVHKLHGSCSESVQCEGLEGICSKGKCICKNNYHYVENVKCFKSKFINQSCTANGNCTIIKNSICSKGTCNCRPGYKSLRNATICSSGIRYEISLSSLILLLLFNLYNVNRNSK